MKSERVAIDITWSAILRIIGAVFGLWLLYSTREIVLLLFLVLIVVMALDPIVNNWERHMPRALAVGLLFALVLGFLSLSISLILPLLVAQIGELANNIPEYARALNVASHNSNFAFMQQLLQGVYNQLSNLSRGLITTTLGILGGLLNILTMIVLSVYLLLDKRGVRNFIVSLLPLKNRENIYKATNMIGDKLGAWVRGQLLLMLVIGITATVWATILGLPYALTLGLWAGLTEVIPFLGPIFGGIPIVLLALAASPVKAIIAIVLLVLTQQLESNFLVPKVMQRSVGLSPVLVIVALLIGSKLFGITGTILSVPAAATLMVLIQEWPRIAKPSK